VTQPAAKLAPNTTQQAGAWNIANAVTILRIAVVPVFAVLLLQDSGHDDAWRYAATGVFAFASMTDRLDG
jgi:CDP-diacylglycerol--glycerol-3-phosphate 3-phosphatidyltransferase